MVWIFTSSVFMTVGLVRRHGDVRIGDPHGPVLLISSRLFFVLRVAHPGMSPLKTLAALPWQRCTRALCWPLRPVMGLKNQDKALCVVVVSDRFFEDWVATCHPPRIPGHSPFAVKRVHLRRPRVSEHSRQSRTSRAAIGHYHEDMMATYTPPGIAEEVDCTSSVIQSELLGGRGYASRNSWKSWPLSCDRKHKRIVLMMKGLEAQNTQDKAERFMAADGHHLEDVVATCHPPGIAVEVAGKIV